MLKTELLSHGDALACLEEAQLKLVRYLLHLSSFRTGSKTMAQLQRGRLVISNSAALPQPLTNWQ
jgi:hypothetical protein